MKRFITNIVALITAFTLLLSPVTQIYAFSFDDALDSVGAAFAIPTAGLSLLPGLMSDGDLFGFGGNDPETQAQANECLNKSVEQLRSEVKQKYANFRSHPNTEAIDSEVSKEKLCTELLNAEDEIQSPSESFLWKPKSDSDGKAVTLLPTSLRGLVVRTDVFEKETGKKLDSGRFSGDEDNGMRPHYRFPKPGASYGGPIQVIAAVAEGIWIWDIKDAAKRTEGIKGKFSTWAEVAAWEAAQAAKNQQGTSPDGDGNGISSCPAGQTDTNTDKSLRVMAMGDSNTAGTDSSNSLAYRKAFKEEMLAKGYTVDMVGSQSSGSGLSDNQHEGYGGRGIAHLQSIANGSTLTAYNPNVILLLVGSNDMWVSLDNRSPISDSAANSKVAALGTLLDTIHTKLPNAKIVVAKPATPSVGSTAATRPLGIYKTGISTLASTRSYVSVVDFTGFGNDGVHYTTAGYNDIAETFANKVDEITRECDETSVPTAGYTTQALCESATGFVCKKDGDEWEATTTRLADSDKELEVTCRVSDTTPGIDDEIDITLDVTGGTSPYEGTWSGDYKKADNFDKDEGDQTISFDKKGSYKIKIKVTDDEKNTATDTCPTIKVTEDGEDDVIVTVTEPAQQVTNNASLASAFYRDLTVGASGSDVTALQQYLVSRGYLVMPLGASYGYFGELTRSALAQFQSASGITPAAGYFGQKTRSYIATGFVPAATFTPQTYTAPVAQTPSVPSTQPATSSCVDITSTVYYGEEGENVTRVQQYLVSTGHLSMPAGSSYGYYGKATVTALSKFMTTRGYVHNGAIMDAKVLGELKAASCR